MEFHRVRLTMCRLALQALHGRQIAKWGNQTLAADGGIVLDHDNAVPVWERRYPGRMEYELNKLRDGGTEPQVDATALLNERLVITFKWKLRNSEVATLRAEYPDSFPHNRPHVFLVSGMASPPVRHRNPFAGNLCLLGRDTRQWIPSLTLYDLLAEKLDEALFGSNNEDPQGEPSEFWWNALAADGSFCLVDSDWNLSQADQGTLVVKWIVEEYAEGEAEGKSTTLPIVQAYVSEIRDQSNTCIANWRSVLPPQLRSGTRTTVVEWVRLRKPFDPREDFASQVRDVRNGHTRLKALPTVSFSSGSQGQIFAATYPCELNHNEMGHGWTFFLFSGDRKAFSPKNARQRRKHPIQVSTIKTLRAGASDLGYRVPAVKTFSGKRITIVGLGAIGAPIAIQFARNGSASLHMVEFDSVDPGNTVRWPLGTSAWGKDKSEALREFLAREYPSTDTAITDHHIGAMQPGLDAAGDDATLNAVLANVDIVVDASTSHGVTTYLAEKCSKLDLPLVCLYGTPNLHGGVVAIYGPDGGCPNCLEHAYNSNSTRHRILPPNGYRKDGGLRQPPGCAEPTFMGASFDLEEISLQAVRVAFHVLANSASKTSTIFTLSLADATGTPCPPTWRSNQLLKHPDCTCN